LRDSGCGNSFWYLRKKLRRKLAQIILKWSGF